MSIDTTITFEDRDEYQRKPIAEKIIRLLSSEVDVSPLIIDGGWGTGKTEFCHKLINLIDEKNKIEIDENDELSKFLDNGKTNIRAIYVDAFKADHADEPLMTLLAAVLRLFPEKEDQKSLKDKALPVLRFGAKTISKGVVSWVLQQDFADVVDDLDDVIEDASNEVIDKTVSSMLDDHVKAEQSIETLKSALKELTKDNPITVFVDELDRCRPDFAISMLESIKHIFDVDGVQFVLVVNTEQLKASVNHCYGLEVNAQKYLDKFIGFKFSISKFVEVNAHEKKFVSQEHFSDLVKNSKSLDNSILNNGNNGSYHFAKEIIGINDLSLREVETFVKYLEIYQELTNKEGLRSDLIFGNGLLRLLGIYLYCFKREVLNHNKLDGIDILEVLGQSKMPQFDSSNYDRPTHVETVAAMLGLEAGLEANDEDKEKWEKQVLLFFRGGGGSYGKKASTVINVADIFDLKT